MSSPIVKRPRFRFRLRTIFIVMFVAACPLAFVANRLHQMQTQASAVAKLRSRGAWANPTTRHWKEHVRFQRTAHYSESYWYEQIFSPLEYHVLWFDPSDDDIREIPSDFCIATLHLARGTVSDDVLAHVGTLKSLRNLTIGGCANITDDGLTGLFGSRGLRKLYISETAVTNEGLEMLQRALPNCDVSDGVGRPPP